MADWKRNPFVLGPLIGLLTGMLWWAGLMIASGPSVAVTIEGGSVVEREITVASRLLYAPIAAIPWAAVGLLVGAIAAAVRGPWVPVAAAFGTVGGGVYSLATSPFDGWLAITMPICCLVGGLAGTAVGVLLRAVGRLIQHAR
ncbi:MAG: hypothetical protein K8U57_37555 [Planctomycetes bacterium]|nr:hypothetical protein [Planctomycetota bacterium]